ncbi:MAG TPA: 16S rRNA (cytosine(967)-C(5))-methyltransferase RsmB [Candidatus Binataceae bacterium]|nr:16S rRNA (cytosine(967)-C(5))-methyltransferase RsmB [Candidatus Binataceae bacterium]
MTPPVRRTPAPPAAVIRKPGAGAGLGARRIALEILLEAEHRGGYADAMLGARIAAQEPADRRLITRLVLGTLAWRGRLDYELEQLTGRDLAGIQPEALELMRMGLLQLRFLDRMPVHAVVSTTVELAKRGAASRVAAGFINAVMRRATRETIALPPREPDLARHLAVAYSHPRWLVERFIEWFGADGAERLLAADNEAAPNVLRLNLGLGSRAEIIERLVEQGFEIGDGGYAPETIRLAGAARFDSEAYRAGLFVAQSEASQLVARMLAPRTGAVLVDLAAAPGGKSTHLAELAGSDARIIALDRSYAGLKNARELAHRLRHHNLEFVRADAAVALPLRAASAEFVLLDAPCTGLGTLREHPEIRWRVRPEDPVRIAVLQSRMLENAAAIVRPGGAIVYSVCSLAPPEGENVVRGFIDAHREFEVDCAPAIRAEAPDLFDAAGFMRTRPDRGGLDGFFAARMIRKSA